MADTPTIEVLVERIANLAQLVRDLTAEVGELREDLAEFRGQQTAITRPAAQSDPSPPSGDWLSRAPNRGQLVIGLITALGVFVPVLVAITNQILK